MSTIDDFNTASVGQVEALIAPCVAIASFATDLAASRPFADLDALLTAARIQVATWSQAEVEAALADHPRIGQRHTGTGTSAAMSHAEQAGIDPDDAALATALAEANTAYEQKFGRIYLVRAAGRSAIELLDLLQTRLHHDPTTEWAITHQQLGEIAMLRLEGLFA